MAFRGAAILGMVLGAMLEEHFISSMLKGMGACSLLRTTDRRALGALTMLVIAWPLARAWLARKGDRP